MAPKAKWPSPAAKASRGRPTGPRGKLRDFLPPSPAMRTPPNGFSMRDEARNTASHQSSLGWPSGDAKLRQRPVTFVSAGVIEPLKDEKASDGPSDPNVAEESPEDAIDAVVTASSEACNAGKLGTETVDVIQVETATQTVEEETVIVELPVEKQLVGDASPPSEVPGSESKELFFFDLGDDQPMANLSIPPPKIPSPRSSFGESDSSEEVILFRGRTANAQGPARKDDVLRPSVMAVSSKASVDLKHEAPTVPSNRPVSQTTTSPSQLRRKRSRSRRNRSQAPKPRKDEEEEAILADYIANMAADSDSDFIGTLQAFSGQRDLGGDDGAVNFGSGDEKSPEGNDWLGNGGAESVKSDSSDAEEDDFLSGDDEDMDAEMDDETVARLLAKQEELGMEGDDLLLFTSSFAQTGSRKSKGKRPANTAYGPASATQVADAFDNLDLADWSHLTGQTRKRRSKQPPNFNVSDSEIEAALKTAWSRDRERKKGRKLEREALRAEGLLGKHANPDDLRVKYPSGMKLDDMKAELTSFLLSSAERLDFPPLDKHARKVLHEIANKFNIKSQSTGKGDQRRPVLYRTNRTVRYASTRLEDATAHVDQASMRVHRKYFHRVDVKVQRTESPRTGGAGRSGHKALTLREGEIVGASVPELGQENKGRNMLEKMGWSKGMSLGALDNQGILEPVAQVMKRSKAGLG